VVGEREKMEERKVESRSERERESEREGVLLCGEALKSAFFLGKSNSKHCASLSPTSQL